MHGKLCLIPDFNPGTTRSFNVFPCNGNGSNIVILRNFIHNIEHKLFDDRTQRSCSGVAFQCLVRNGFQCALIKLKLYLIQLQKLLILL